MKIFSAFSIVCSVFLLNACDHYSERLASMEVPTVATYDIAPAAGGNMTFGGYLASEYYQLARYEQDQMHDYKAASYFTKKADKLSKGVMVAPAHLREFDLEKVSYPDLVSARAELMEALRHYSIPDNRQSLARAQTRYECWLDQEQENKEVKSCQIEFRQAMNSLIEPEEDADLFLNDLLMDDAA